MKNRVQSKLVYLVEYDLQVAIVFKTPPGLKLSPQKTMWFLRNFEFLVGQDTHLEKTTLPWNGPIGVYNIHNPLHVKMMLAQMQRHMEKCAFQRVLNNVHNAGFSLEEMKPASGSVPQHPIPTRLWRAIREAFTF